MYNPMVRVDFHEYGPMMVEQGAKAKTYLERPLSVLNVYKKYQTKYISERGWLMYRDDFPELVSLYKTVKEVGDAIYVLSPSNMNGDIGGVYSSQIYDHPDQINAPGFLAFYTGDKWKYQAAYWTEGIHLFEDMQERINNKLPVVTTIQNSNLFLDLIANKKKLTLTWKVNGEDRVFEFEVDEDYGYHVEKGWASE